MIDKIMGPRCHKDGPICSHTCFHISSGSISMDYNSSTVSEGGLASASILLYDALGDNTALPVLATVLLCAHSGLHSGTRFVLGVQ